MKLGKFENLKKGTYRLVALKDANGNNKFDPKIRVTLGSNEAIKQAVAGDLGLSIVSIHSLTEHDVEEMVHILDVDQLPIKSQWHIVTLKGHKLSPIAKVFHDHMLNKVKEINLKRFK